VPFNNNDNNAQDDIYSAIIYVATRKAICESSLWVLHAKVGQRQVAKLCKLYRKKSCRYTVRYLVYNIVNMLNVEA